MEEVVNKLYVVHVISFWEMAHAFHVHLVKKLILVEKHVNKKNAPEEQFFKQMQHVHHVVIINFHRIMEANVVNPVYRSHAKLMNIWHVKVFAADAQFI